VGFAIPLPKNPSNIHPLKILTFALSSI
jgi:hypothetical protein